MIFKMFFRRYLTDCSRINKRVYAVSNANLKNVKQFNSKPKHEESDQHEHKEHNLAGDLSRKYKVFRDIDSKEILDVNEERFENELEQEEAQEAYDMFEGLNLERGETGVFDLEDLIQVLERENVIDIFVAEMPKDINFVDHICIVSAKSGRHLLAIAEFVRKVFKQKRNSTDSIPKIEGQNSRDWVALDLGNIALHIFLDEARKQYDLESLWALGCEYDSEYNKKDPLVDLLEKHSIYLKDFKPAS